MRRISLIIVNYNSKKILEDCLDSLMSSNAINGEDEVFVIDNASTESIADLKDKYCNFTFVFNNTNMGFAGANNIGIRLSSGKYILLLNPDTIVNQNSFVPMMNYLDSHPDTGVVGCRIFSPSGEVEHSTHSFPSILKEFVHANEFLKPIISYDSKLGEIIGRLHFLQPFESYWNHDTEKEVGHVTGACMMVRRQVVEEVGMLDEAFFLYTEEVEWSYRIKAAGYKTVFLPYSSIIHLFGYSTKQGKQKQAANWLLVERYRGMLYFFKKHYGPLQLMILKLIILEGFAFRLLFNYIKTLSLGSGSSRQNIKEENENYRKIMGLVFKRDFDWRVKK